MWCGPSSGRGANETQRTLVGWSSRGASRRRLVPVAGIVVIRGRRVYFGVQCLVCTTCTHIPYDPPLDMAHSARKTPRETPYELLGLSQEAANADIRTAYGTRSLKVHLDRLRLPFSCPRS